MSIEALLQALLGRGDSAEKSGPASGSALMELLGALSAGNGQRGPQLDSILSGLLGGADPETGIAAQTGLPANLAQSAIAMIAGKLLAGGGEQGDASGLSGLLERMRSQGEVDEASLNATGLPQELAAKAGIDLPDALKAVEAILALLTGKSATSTRKKRTSTRKASTARARQTKSGTTKSTKSTSRSSKTTGAAKSTSKSTARSSEKASGATKPATKSTRQSSSKTTDATKPTAKSTTRSRSKPTDATKPATKPTTRSRKTSDTAKPKDELDNLLDQWSVTG